MGTALASQDVKHVTSWALNFRGKYAGRIVCNWTKTGLTINVDISAGTLPHLHTTGERDVKQYLESIGYSIHDML